MLSLFSLGIHMMKLLTSALFIVLMCEAASAQCRCGPPAGGESTHEGGNELITHILPRRLTSIHGVAEDINGKAIGGALVEVFDRPEWIRQGHIRSKVEQRRVAACRTKRDGNFCFRGIPPGEYELRLSKSKMWNVNHILLVVDPESPESTKAGVRVVMYLGS
jgi:hypothetical protein